LANNEAKHDAGDTFPFSFEGEERPRLRHTTILEQVNERQKRNGLVHFHLYEIIAQNLNYESNQLQLKDLVDLPLFNIIRH